MNIVRPLTQDGLFGYDEHDQLVLCVPESHGRTYTFAHDVRHEICALCEHGWEHNGPAIADQTRWDLIGKHVHLSCLARHISFVQRATVFAAIVAARLRFKTLRAVPNHYWGPNDRWGKHIPWYVAELLDHPYTFTIGHRKSVWSIECRVQDPGECSWFRDATTAFADEVVTKQFDHTGVLIHAWADEKLHQYVKTIAEVGGLNKPRAEHD